MAIKKAQQKAAAARGRMARRAKRDRFIKENKKRIMMIIAGFFALLFLVFGTPWGPAWYYSKIQETKFSAPNRLSHGTITKLYKLGVFYQNTMRKNDALKCYDEIATYYFGFTLNEYSASYVTALDKQHRAEVAIKKGLSGGPPYAVADDELQYVALTIYQYGMIIRDTRSKQFTYRIWNDLYLEQFYKKYPQYLDPSVTKQVDGYVKRIMGQA